MASTSPDLRTLAVQNFLDGEHFRFRRHPGASARPDEVEITPAWSVRLEGDETPLLRRMQMDFIRFCRECFDVPLAESSSATTQRIVWELTTTPPAAFDRRDPAVETFTLTVTADEVRLQASHERGLLHGTHFLEWLMADRGGPFLTSQSAPHQPAFMPRISNGVFIHGHQLLTDPGHFSDDYLSLMSHYGVNGIHIYVDLWNVFQSATLPELNSPDIDVQLAALNAFNQRTLAFGIDLYLHINTPPLAADHPVFAAHPGARGALVEIFMEEISGREWYNLCSGSPEVLAAYSEAIENLFTRADQVAGMMMIIGGECFYHCYTRPANSDNGDTNCPHCHGKSASSEVAHLVNTATKAIKKTGQHKPLFAWPYSAFIWSSKDPHQVEFLKQLDPEVSVLSNFDCGDFDENGVFLFDYNIKCIGPSTTFAQQLATQRELQRPIFTKVESCTTADAFFLPHLPLYQRWFSRVSSMKEQGVAGFVGQWRFFGMNASPPEEIQYKATWNPVSCDDVLRTRCFRDFQVEGPAADRTIEGWRLLSESWDIFPYSSNTGGERAGYMRGPFYLGPSHPLIFDVQDQYKLPRAFFSLRGDLAELATTPEELQELQRNAKPRYISDLLITLPFGVDRYLELLQACRQQWAQGLALLKETLSGRGDRAQKELDICEAMDAHLRTLENVVRFYQGRDILQNTRSTPAAFRAQLARMTEIIDDEIANAERILPILARDPRIGYGHCYGPVYDADMVTAKIAQCRYVRDVEFPRFSKVIRFHNWGETP